jgi:hypothetical protein
VWRTFLKSVIDFRLCYEEKINETSLVLAGAADRVADLRS